MFKLFDSRNSYLLINEPDANVHVTKVLPMTNAHLDNLLILPNYLSDKELQPYEETIAQLRTQTFSDGVGQFCLGARNYKYIAHAPGRYDIWDIGTPIKMPEVIAPYKVSCKSVGALLLNAQTLTDGKWHKDAVELFDGNPNNKSLPPFYFNLLIALEEQTATNGPTQFWDERTPDTAYWVPLRRGDAVLFDGNLLHRGTANNTLFARDLIYATFTTDWYNEEQL